MSAIYRVIGKYLTDDATSEQTINHLGQLSLSLPRDPSQQCLAVIGILHLMIAMMRELQADNLQVFHIYAKAAVMLILDTASGEESQNELAEQMYPVLAVIAMRS